MAEDVKDMIRSSGQKRTCSGKNQGFVVSRHASKSTYSVSMKKKQKELPLC